MESYRKRALELSRRRVAFVAALLISLVLLAVWILPPLLARPSGPLTAAEELKAQDDVRGTLIQGIGVLILAFGLYFTARTFRVSREGYITDRFAKAIEHVGDATTDVRLGGIYSLERIARDGGRIDGWVVIQILTSFVHEHSPWPPEDERKRVPPDVEAAVNALGRLASVVPSNLGGRMWVDLSDLDLRGGKFDVANFHGFDLRGTHFDGSSLILTDLQYARLHRTSFADVETLDLAVLNHAHFSERTTVWPKGFDARAAEAKGAAPVPDADDLKTDRERRQRQEDELTAERARLTKRSTKINPDAKRTS